MSLFEQYGWNFLNYATRQLGWFFKKTRFIWSKTSLLKYLQYKFLISIFKLNKFLPPVFLQYWANVKPVFSTNKLFYQVLNWLPIHFFKSWMNLLWSCNEKWMNIEWILCEMQMIRNWCSNDAAMNDEWKLNKSCVNKLKLKYKYLLWSGRKGKLNLILLMIRAERCIHIFKIRH